MKKINASILLSTVMSMSKYRWNDNGLDYELIENNVKNKRMPLSQEETETLSKLHGREKKKYLRELGDKYWGED